MPYYCSRRLAFRWLARVALLTALLAFTTAAEACPTCKAGLASGGDHLVSAYMWSILFMMSMPFTLLGLTGGYLYLQVRKAQAQAARAACAAPGASAMAAPSAAREEADEFVVV